MDTKFVTLERDSIHYLEAGTGDTVIIIPSFALTSRSYCQFGDMLAEKYHVLIPDLYKGKTFSAKSALIFDDYVESLNRFVMALQLRKFCLIGPSFGGIISFKFSQKYPKRIKKLLLVSIGVAPSKFTYFDLIFGYAKLTFNNMFSAQGWSNLLLWYSEGFYNLLKNPRQIFLDARMSTRPISENDIHIHSPTLLLYAKKDEYFPFNSFNSMKKIHNLKIEVIDDHHAWFFSDKKRFVDITKRYFDSDK